jgi:SAM-dependent methyltransferase
VKAGKTGTAIHGRSEETQLPGIVGFVTHQEAWQGTPESGRVPTLIDTSTPNVARMYDYYLGGKDNFEADRIAAEQILRQMPGQRKSALENRRFLRRAVRFLAGEAGISQFLDIGVGLPTQGAVHEVAHESNPQARVAYVDHDPVVVSHANALLATPNLSVVVQEDIRRPRELLANPVIRQHLDFSRPVAVVLSAVLHFVSDDDDPDAITAVLRDALAPGSYLVISHVCQDLLPDKAAAERAKKVYEQASERIQARSAERITGFFGDFELVDPGLVAKHAWRPVTGVAPSDPTDISMGGVGRKAG